MKNYLLTLGFLGVLCADTHAQCDAVPTLAAVRAGTASAPLIAGAGSTANSIYFNWNPCNDLQGGCRVCYKVEWAAKGAAFSLANTTLSYSTSVSIRRLQPATDYKVRVTATGCDGVVYVLAMTGDDNTPAATNPNSDADGDGIADAYIRTCSALCQANSFETGAGNNTFATASNIPNGTTTFSVINRLRDEDWYIVEHTGGFLNVGLLNVARNTPTANNFTYQVFDNEARPVAFTMNVRNIIWGDFAFSYDRVGSSDAALSAGKYYIRVFSNSGYDISRCYALRTSSSATASSATLQKEAATTPISQLEVFPNPVQQLANIVLPRVETETIATLRLTDMTGKEMLRQEVLLNENVSFAQLDVANVSNGMYLVSVQYAAKTFTKKIIVHHEQ